MTKILQILSIILAIFLYIGATDNHIIEIISHKNFYLTYMSILYLVFLANILFFYGFYDLVRPIKHRQIIFKSILWSLFVISPYILSLLYGTYFNDIFLASKII